MENQTSQLQSQLDTDQIKKRSISGAIAYTSRTVLLQAIGFVAFFMLTVLLTEDQLGVFFVVDATVGFLVYFSDVGLAAALIQKKSKLTKQDLATTFTIQQFLVLSLSLIALLSSKSIAGFFGYDEAATFLFQALVISFFLSSLKTIPSILLERSLEFNKLVIPQVLEQIVFYTTAVYMAWKGYGVASYSYAVLFRAIVGLVAIYILQPWMPRFGFNKKVAKSLASFGAPFQMSSILALFKDRLLIVFLGKVLPPAQIAYIGWAEKWAMTPIRFFADPILRVTFPAYSRLQNNKAALTKAIEKSIFFVATLVFPAVIGMVIVAPMFLEIIPKYSKWQPALIPLVFFGINAMFSSISITLTNTLNATGKVKTTLKLMVMWTVLTWILTPFLLKIFGYTGVAIASALTASSSMIAVYLVNKIVKIRLLPQLAPPLLSTLIMFLTLSFAKEFTPKSTIGLLLTIILGAAIYTLSLFVVARDKITSEINSVKRNLIK